MRPFADIRDEAALRHGGEQALLEKLPIPATEDELRRRPESDYLSLMSRRIFRAGLRHSMVDDKWPAFEQLFHGFDIEAVRLMSDEDLEQLLADKRIIRHWGKIKSVRSNAQAIAELGETHKTVGEYLAEWPSDSIVQLWDDLKRRFSQLGGNSGPYFLRMAGKDTFLFTVDVVRALNRWGGLTGEPRGKRARLTAQQSFNQWAEESGLPMCQISRILALSVD